MKTEEVLTLKIAEHVLNRDMLDGAIRALLRSVRPAGTSQYQSMVLTSLLEEVERRANDAMNVQWPTATEPLK